AGSHAVGVGDHDHRLTGTGQRLRYGLRLTPGSCVDSDMDRRALQALFVPGFRVLKSLAAPGGFIAEGYEDSDVIHACILARMRAPALGMARARIRRLIRVSRRPGRRPRPAGFPPALRVPSGGRRRWPDGPSE